MNDIRLKAEEVWERGLTRKIENSDELRVRTRSGEELIGFVIGFDEFWLEMLDSDLGRKLWVQQDAVDSVRETGRTVGELVDVKVKKRVEASTLRLRTKIREGKHGGAARD